MSRKAVADGDITKVHPLFSQQA
jgi:hypothetical protein